MRAVRGLSANTFLSPAAVPAATRLPARPLRLQTRHSKATTRALSSTCAVRAPCMFQLATLQDTAVKIVPENLGLPRLEALTQRLENTYVDKARIEPKNGAAREAASASQPFFSFSQPTADTAPSRQVIENAGLCVTLYEILSVEGGTVFQGEGDAHFVVKFKLVRNRPLRPRACRKRRSGSCRWTCRCMFDSGAI